MVIPAPCTPKNDHNCSRGAEYIRSEEKRRRQQFGLLKWYYITKKMSECTNVNILNLTKITFSPSVYGMMLSSSACRIRIGHARLVVYSLVLK